MDTVAYIYFNSPEKDSVIDLFKEIIKSGVNVTHFGRNDPPKKWNATPDEMNNELFKEEAETNKWCFLKDQKQKIEMTIHITYADNWSFSDIDISGKIKKTQLTLLLILLNQLILTYASKVHLERVKIKSGTYYTKVRRVQKI